MDNQTALAQLEQSRHTRRSWVWLLDRLRDYVDLRGCRPEDEERLGQFLEETYFEAVFMIDPAGKAGPTADILSAFRENAELWLSACPAAEHVVVLPRKLAEQIVAALPVADGDGATKLEYVENAGHALLRSGAAVNRINREEEERTSGERIRSKVLRWIDDEMKRAAKENPDA